jgi:hypothetical protein
METAEKLFNQIVEKYTHEYKNVTLGKMMSSPALKYNNKVFVFFYEQQMIFKLGEEFDPGSFGLSNVKLLNPFKTKGPLRGWFVVGYNNHSEWDKLTKLAYEKMSTNK